MGFELGCSSGVSQGSLSYSWLHSAMELKRLFMLAPDGILVEGRWALLKLTESMGWIWEAPEGLGRLTRGMERMGRLRGRSRMVELGSEDSGRETRAYSWTDMRGVMLGEWKGVWWWVGGRRKLFCCG